MESFKETKELLKFVIDFTIAVDKSLSDGTLSIFDTANFLPLIQNADTAFKDISKIPTEFSQLAEEDIQTLYDFIKSKLDLSNDKIEILITKSLEIIINFYQLYMVIKEK